MLVQLQVHAIVSSCEVDNNFYLFVHLSTNGNLFMFTNKDSIEAYDAMQRASLFSYFEINIDVEGNDKYLS